MAFGGFSGGWGRSSLFAAISTTRLWTRAVSIAAFRIVQESLSNVLRHARARRASVSVTDDGEGISIRVEDDGIGIPQETLNDHRSYGIIGMQVRVIELGGGFSMSGDPGKGSVVAIKLPRAPKADSL